MGEFRDRFTALNQIEIGHADRFQLGLIVVFISIFKSLLNLGRKAQGYGCRCIDLCQSCGVNTLLHREQDQSAGTECQNIVANRNKLFHIRLFVCARCSLLSCKLCDSTCAQDRISLGVFSGQLDRERDNQMEQNGIVDEQSAIEFMNRIEPQIREWEQQWKKLSDRHQQEIAAFRVEIA